MRSCERAVGTRERLRHAGPLPHQVQPCLSSSAAPTVISRTRDATRSSLSCAQASVAELTCQTLVPQDEHERRVRLLLLSKAAVLAHRFDRPLAAELDEYEQRRTRGRARTSSLLLPRMRRLGPFAARAARARQADTWDQECSLRRRRARPGCLASGARWSAPSRHAAAFRLPLGTY